MRKFAEPEWGYTVGIFDKISAKKKYAVKARLEYFNTRVECSSSGAWFKTYYIEWLKFIKLAANLFYFQVFKPIKPGSDIEFVFLISNNNTYIQHMKGIINHYIAENRKIIILCPANQFGLLQTKLDKSYIPYLRRFEQISAGGNFIVKLSGWFYSFFAGIFDSFWFWGQDVKSPFYFSSSFAKYGFIHHYLDRQYNKVFKVKRKLVAADDHWFWESMVFYAARETGTASYLLEHGIVGDYQYPMFAKKFLAWGQFDADKMLKEFEAPPGEVEKTGSPFFDLVYLKYKDGPDNGQLDKPYITFLTQYYFDSPNVKPEHFRQVIERFYALQPIAEKHNRKLVLKLHPLDKPSHYFDKGDKVILTREPLIDVLEQSCVALTFDSTSIFEAVLLKVPILQSHLKEKTRFADFTGSGLTLNIQSLEEQNEIIDKLLGSRTQFEERIIQQNRALDNYFFGLGHSIQTMAEVIDKS